jgi:Ca2+-transporting ATPase
MQEAPRRPSAPLFTVRDGLGVLFVGAVMGLAALFAAHLPEISPALFAVPDAPLAAAEARTMAFCVLALSPLFHAFNARSAHESVFSVGLLRNRWLVAAVLASAAIQFAAVGIPSLFAVFKTTTLSLEQWLIVVLLAALPLVFVEVAKLFERLGRRLLFRPSTAATRSTSTATEPTSSRRPGSEPGAGRPTARSVLGRPVR